MPLPAVAVALRAALAIAARTLPRAMGGAVARQAARKLAAGQSSKAVWGWLGRKAVTHAVNAILHEGKTQLTSSTDANGKQGTPDVVEDAAATTAQALTAQLSGQNATPGAPGQPAAPQGGQAATPAPVIQIVQPQSTAPPPVQGPTAVAQPQGGGPTQPPPGGGGSSAPAPSPAPPPTAGGGSTPPPAPPPAPNPVQHSGGFFDAIQQKWNQAKDAYDQWRNSAKSVADQVKGLTPDQRYDRLQKAGNLLPISDVAKQTGTPYPTRDQQIQASEDAEESRRQRDADEAGKAPISAGRVIGHAAIGLPAALTTLIQAFETLGRRVSDSNRHLSRFNGVLAASYAQRDVAQLRSDFKTAQGTAGTGAMLNDQLAKLIEEVQPMKETVIRLLNTVAAIGVMIARGANGVLGVHAAFAALKLIGEKIEENTKKPPANNDTAMVHQRMLRDVVKEIRKPLNPPPNV